MSTHFPMITIVPKEMLSADVLRKIVMEFVSREGTDYGHTSWTLDEKADQVLAQIDRGEVVVTYNDDTETCNLAKYEDAKRELEHREALERGDFD